MSISLIVTKSFDRDFNETGESISLDEWLAFIESDSALSLRTEPLTATDPNGSVISMSAPEGQSEFSSGGESIPFLALRSGELQMPYHPNMQTPSNPVRQRVSEIAQHLDALITNDADDEFLDW